LLKNSNIFCKKLHVLNKVNSINIKNYKLLPVKFQDLFFERQENDLKTCNLELSTKKASSDAFSLLKREDIPMSLILLLIFVKNSTCNNFSLMLNLKCVISLKPRFSMLCYVFYGKKKICIRIQKIDIKA